MADKLKVRTGMLIVQQPSKVAHVVSYVYKGGADWDGLCGKASSTSYGGECSEGTPQNKVCSKCMTAYEAIKLTVESRKKWVNRTERKKVPHGDSTAA